MTAPDTNTLVQMKLSKETLEILANFAGINNNMGFRPGTRTQVMSPSQTIAAIAQIKEPWPATFAIYEMSRLLGVLGLSVFADATLTFVDDKHVVIQSGQTKVDYFFSSQKFVDPIGDKTPVMSSVDLVINVSAEMFSSLDKAAAALGHKFLKINVIDGVATLVATSPDLDTSNDYAVTLADAHAHPTLPEITEIDGIKVAHDATTKIVPPDATYMVKLENLRLLPGDYTIMLSKAQRSKFSHMTRPVEYYVGLEST